MNKEKYTRVMAKIDQIEAFAKSAEQKTETFFKTAADVLEKAEGAASEVFAGFYEGIEKERARVTKEAEKDIWASATDSAREEGSKDSSSAVDQVIKRLADAYRASSRGAGMSDEDIADRVRKTVDDIMNRS